MRSRTDVGLVVARLDTLEVEDRDAAQPGQLAGERASTTASIAEARMGMASVEPARVDGRVDVGRLDGLEVPGASETSSKP